MRAQAETLLTVAAIRTARLLHDAPHYLERFTAMADRYVDWRGRSVPCRTAFGALIPCRLSDIIQRKIAYFGVWEPHLTHYIRRALAPGDVLIDVGANIGYYSLLASGLVGAAGKVVAIEASPRIFAMLSHNIQVNRATNIRAVNKAAAARQGFLPVFAAPSGNIGHTSTLPLAGNVFEATIEALPLAEMLSTEEMARARLIKIDIEGAEGPVIRSFLETIKFYGAACELAVEVSPDSQWVLTEMERHGFHAYQIANDYSDRDYISRTVRPPERHQGLLEEQADFVFSRRDTDYL